ncbi:MAG: type II toxin-antitoxin system HipA family toxin, partial [Woeseiaceae bacterium]
EKLHMQSLYALAHLDNQLAGAHSYEQAFDAMRRLDLGVHELEEMFRRMVFNVIARNQDDHTKNIAFLMDKSGNWALAPAFDVIYAYNPNGAWTSRHQMTINGLRDGFRRSDMLAVADRFHIASAGDIIEQVLGAARNWPEHAATAGVPDASTAAIADTHRTLQN